MKKILSFLFILSFFSSNICFSQSGWYNTFVNNASVINKIAKRDSSTYFAFTQSSIAFLKSTNGGMNWTGEYYIAGFGSGYNRYPKFICTSFFVNSLTGFVGTFAKLSSGFPTGNIYRTGNGGLNWDSVTGTSYCSYKALFFINESTGWSCCSPENGLNFVLKTTNGGFSWYTQDSTIKAIYSINFINSNVGWFAGYYRLQYPAQGAAFYVYKTTNGGQSFITQMYNNQVIQTLKTVFFVNENTGWAGGTNLWKTTDSGNSWNSQAISANCIYFANSQTGYLINDAGICKTSNSGLNWFQQSNIDGNSISGVDANNVFTAGNYGSLAKTSNGGLNWQQLSTSITKDDVLKRVFFVNNSTGYIACDSGNTVVNSGKIIKTTNAGINWSIIYNMYGSRFYDIYFSDVNTGWTISDLNVFKTTNGGLNWWTQLNTSYRIDKLCFINQNTGWASSNIALYYTSNGGNNWLNVCNPFYAVEYIHFYNALTGIISSGGVRRTTNGGYNWQQVFSAAWCIDADSTGNSILYTLPSFYKSNDFGFTWNLISTFPPMPIFTLDMVTSSIGYGGGLGGWLIKTTDGGMTWNRQNSKYSGEIWSIHFINETTGWFVGEDGAILSTIDGGGNFVSIIKHNMNLPTSPSLFQNYPNPFNPITIIKYDIPPSKGARGMMVQLIIYDVLGREIETLVNQSQKPGSYEVTWDGSRYASGVYFYKLMTDEWTETKKMVLIK